MLALNRRIFPAADFEFEIKTENENAEKLHRVNAYQLLFQKDGKIVIDTGNNKTHVEKSNILLFPKNSDAQISLNDKRDLVRMIFSSMFISQIISGGAEQKMLERFGFDGLQSSILQLQLTDEISQTISQITNSILQERCDKKPGYENMIRCKFTELLLVLYRTNTPLQQIAIECSNALSIPQVITFIEENYADDFTLKSLSTRCGVHPVYLSQRFHEFTGTTLFAFINRIRIEKSAMLLKKTEKQILDISLQVGYQNLSFYNRYFKKLMGMTPRDYRKYIKS